MHFLDCAPLLEGEGYDKCDEALLGRALWPAKLQKLNAQGLAALGAPHPSSHLTALCLKQLSCHPSTVASPPPADPSAKVAPLGDNKREQPLSGRARWWRIDARWRKKLGKAFSLMMSGHCHWLWGQLFTQKTYRRLHHRPRPLSSERAGPRPAASADMTQGQVTGEPAWRSIHAINNVVGLSLDEFEAYTRSDGDLIGCLQQHRRRASSSQKEGDGAEVWKAVAIYDLILENCLERLLINRETELPLGVSCAPDMQNPRPFATKGAKVGLEASTRLRRGSSRQKEMRLMATLTPVVHPGNRTPAHPQLTGARPLAVDSGRELRPLG